MLPRTASSRRRRASRSAAASPQARPATAAQRRASVAVGPAADPAERRRNAGDLSPRHSVAAAPDVALGGRSPRGSLVPEFDRSPRNSLLPDSQRSPRHSLAPSDYSRSPRNSLVPDSALSPRNSLVPEASRSPRHSLVPDSPAHYGCRLSVSTEFGKGGPRGRDLLPSPTRQGLSPSESTTWERDEGLRSPRHSIAPAPGEPLRSPRGSIAAPESLGVRTSPRGSLGGDGARGGLARSGALAAEEGGGRSPRGSLTLTFQEPLAANERRASADNTAGMGTRGRSVSPYRSGSRGTVNAGYSGNYGFSEGGSRRASSSVSQVSGDEQRRLCADQKYAATHSVGLSISLTTYGSVAYQLKDANLEASGTCDFVCRALSIVNKTVVVTIMLVCLSILPIIMLIMGIQFLRDCPREPNIPIYMVVGGSVGCIKMALTLWSQLHTRRTEVATMNATSIGSKVGSLALTVLLITWFALGNYWILRIKWPDYAPTLFEPNKWCHKTLYVFSLVHLCIIYSLIGVVVALMVVLAGCQLFGCPWLGPTRFK